MTGNNLARVVMAGIGLINCSVRRASRNDLSLIEINWRRRPGSRLFFQSKGEGTSVGRKFIKASQSLWRWKILDGYTEKLCTLSCFKSGIVGRSILWKVECCRPAAPG
jgi:hypothetical protein